MSVFNDDFLFIHIPKTAGSSIKEWLWAHLPNARGQQPGTWPHDPNHDTAGLPIGHVPLMDIERFTGRSPDSFQKIVAIVRDPYKQQLSQWRFWRERRAIFHGDDPHPHDAGAGRHPTLPSWLEDPQACDFHLWYESHHREGADFHMEPFRYFPANRYAGFPGYYHYWLNVKGVIPSNVDVVKVEELSERWSDVMAPFTRGDVPPLPHSNKGAPLPYPWQAYYTPRAAELVEAKFRWAFEHFYEVAA